MSTAIDRKMLRRVLDKYIPRLVDGGVVFVGNPEFDLHAASEGTVYRYIRVTRSHLKRLRKLLTPDEDPLVEVVRNFDADILAVYLCEAPPHIDDA